MIVRVIDTVVVIFVENTTERQFNGVPSVGWTTETANVTVTRPLNKRTVRKIQIAIILTVKVF